MPRYIVIRLNDGYNGEGKWLTTQEAYGTDDVTATVKQIAEAGYDIGVELDDEDYDAVPESVDKVVAELMKSGRWGIGDGADDLALIDLHNLQDASTLGKAY